MSWLQSIPEWFVEHEALTWWLGITSVVMFLGSLAILPVIVARIPADYFTREKSARSARRHPLMHVLVLIGRNVLGAIILLAGIAMLVLPGQGIIAILLGLILMTIPGKRWVARKIIRQPKVYRGVNWLRRRSRRPPLAYPNGADEPEKGDSGAESVHAPTR